MAVHIHPRCWPRLRAPDTSDPVGAADPVQQDLPDLEDIFTMKAATKESVPKGLMPLARAEYGKLLARVLRYTREDAWDDSQDVDMAGGDSREAGKQRARDAWLELLMFPKPS